MKPDRLKIALSLITALLLLTGSAALAEQAPAEAPPAEPAAEGAIPPIPPLPDLPDLPPFPDVQTGSAPETEGQPIQLSAEEIQRLALAAAPLPKPPVPMAADVPNDGGGVLLVTWPEPKSRLVGVESIRVLRAQGRGPESVFEELATIPATDLKYQDGELTDGEHYRYQLEYIAANGTSRMGEPGPVASSSAQWFDMSKLPLLVISILFSASVMFNIQRARNGGNLYVRPIAGLKAIEEAVGRATEMGKPILYVPGIMDMDDVQTIAAVSILGQVAKEVAEYDAELVIPNRSGVVMSACQNVVREAFLEAGRPDAYNAQRIFYLTDDQFGYAAGVDGIMVREKPAANFLVGRFFAESLILAETGNSVGAIQVAATAESSQLPFFVTACDYTLLGEELFAASAYLTREPMQLGSLKGQDWGKVIMIATIVILVALLNMGNESALGLLSGSIFQ